jgi:hypothetical protein
MLTIAFLCMVGFCLALLPIILDSQRYSQDENNQIVFIPNERYNWLLTIETNQYLSEAQLGSVYEQLQHERTINSGSYELTNGVGNLTGESKIMGTKTFRYSIAEFHPSNQTDQIGITLLPNPNFTNIKFSVRSTRPVSGLRILLAIGLWITATICMLDCVIAMIRSDWMKLKRFLKTP